MTRTELAGVQYLRAIAAIFVVVDHTAAMARFPKYFNRDVAGGFFLSGSVGVELFFVISGFIIAYISLADVSLQPTLTLASFLRKRFVRIIPFMWLCILAYAVIRLVARGELGEIPPYVRALFLYPVGSVEPSVIWTLRHEFLFYVLFSLFVIRFRWWPVLVLWFVAPFFWFPFFESTPSFLTALGDFVFNRVNILFGIGYALGIAYRKGYLRFSVRVNNSFILTVLLSLPLFLFAYLNHIEQTNLTLYTATTTGLISVIILIWGIFIIPRHPPDRVDRLGILLGNASYSVYLTHSAIVSALLGVWSAYQPNANLYLVLAVVLVCCLAGGYVVHVWVEKPLITLTGQLFNRIAPGKYTLARPPVP